MAFSFGKPTKKKFAQLLIDKLAQNHDKQYRLDSAEFKLLEVGASGELNLANVWIEYCNMEKSARDDFVTRIAAMLGAFKEELPDNFDEAKKHLRPKLITRCTVESLNFRQRLKGEAAMDFPLTPLGRHLFVTLAYDSESSIRSLSMSDLEGWGISIYEAMEVAKENLQETTEAWAGADSLFYASATHDNYDSARLLLVETIQRFELTGNPIAIAPTRDSLLIGGSANPDSIRTVFQLAEETAQEESRPLSPLPLELVDGEWVDWEPPPNHLLRELWERNATFLSAQQYEEQKSLIDQAIDLGEPLPFAASFMAFQKEDSEKIQSTSVWSKDVDTLLPRTQILTLVTEEGCVASGLWGHVEEVVGDLLQIDDAYYPIRYRTRGFPTLDQLAEIGEVM